MINREDVRQLIKDYFTLSDEQMLDRLTNEVAREVEVFTYATIRELVSQERHRLYLANKKSV